MEEVETLPISETDVELASLRADKERLTQAITIIADELLQEAEMRDWCSEYDEFVARVNGRLPAEVPALRACERTYEVTFLVDASEEQVRSLEADVDRVLQALGLGPCSGYGYERR